MSMTKTNLLGIALLATTGLGAATALADPIAIDVGAAGSAGTAFDADTMTGAVDEWQLFADTTTTLFDTDGSFSVTTGDQFTDSGDAVFTASLPNVDKEGIAEFGGSNIAVTWRDITGEILSSTSTPTGTDFDQNYTGGTFDFYFQDAGAIAFDFGSGVGQTTTTGVTSVGIADNTGFDAGTRVLSLDLVGGTGTSEFDNLGNYLTGAFNLDFNVTFALDDFWEFTDGSDFATLIASSIAVRAQADANTNDVVQRPGGPAGALFQVDSNHDGSISFERDIQVPVPGSLALFGLGTLLLGFRLRRS